MGRMKYTAFREVANSLPDCKDFEHFVAERGWQEWMEDYTDADDSSDRIVEILIAIRELRDNPVKGIKNVVHTTSNELSEEYGIPLRSLENWACGARECPKYVWQMLAYCVFSDNGIL